MRRFKKATAILLAVVMAFVVMLPSSAYAVPSIQSGNRVYFYNMSGNGAACSDFIMVESKGHWGLIDTGHRYQNTITDADGKKYPAYQANSLSSQVKNKNGLAAAQYMVNALGVNHLDFIVGTHSHSDHIGGVPEIASYTFKDSNGATKHLVDNDTVYFYKEYHHINDEQDDIYKPTTGSWHNQAFAYQAKTAMQAQGCVLADVSEGLFVGNGAQSLNDYSELTASVNLVSGLSNVEYDEGSRNDYYDDNISFTFGDMSISLYNLFMHRTTIDENVNSIVALISCNQHTLVSLADINVENRAEQKVASAIRSRYGTVDVMKAAHHGVTRGSNSKETIDLLQPKVVVATRGISDVYSSQVTGAYANAMYYAKPKYGTVFYEVGASERALVVDMNNVSLYSLTESATLKSAAGCINRMSLANGWSNWDNEWGKTTIRDIYYFQNGSPKKNCWIKWNSKWFYVSADGRMQTGWLKIGGIWYYFIESQEVANDYGAAVSGWRKINGVWYYFTDANAMKTGWLKENNKWYYLNGSGAMQTGWKQIGGTWYYFNTSGAMVTGWLKNGGHTYYLNSSGKMVTGAQRINGRSYYFNSSGALK